MTTVHDAALIWHDAGGCILPAADDGTKRPGRDCLVKIVDPDGRERWTWDLYKKERPSREQVAAWASRNTGIGLVCGRVSGGVEMLELEATAIQEELHDQLRQLVESAGYPELWAKLQTYVEQSPKGGIHWVFRVEGGVVPGNTKLAKRPDPTPEDPHRVTTLIETRGEGGWTIISPSNGPTHETGRPWMLISGTPGQIPTLTVDEVETLHRLARTFDEMPELPPPADPRPTMERKAGEKTPGDEFNQRTDWIDILVPAGWVVVGRRGDVTYWRRPGKNFGVSATTGYGDQGHDLLYVFSTSTEFESERSYSKLGAHALLNHNGDFVKATSELRRRGFGDPLPTPERFDPITLINGEGLGGPAQPPSAPTPASPLGEVSGQPPAEDPPSWGRVDLTEYLDGSHVPQVPELMPRIDGNFLLYRGRVHSFHGESESGKSWMALAAVAVELNAGHDCLMVDFESDAHTTVGRLLRLGVAPENIRDHFDYRRPEQSPMGLAREFQAWAEMLAGSYAIAILDGVTEALAVFGVVSKDNDEVTVWIRTIPRKLAAATGAAVILVDHVTKDADSRGRFAIGGQAKMAALDGAAYVIEVIDPLGVGLVGRVSMRVAKDRPGGVRPHSGPYRKSDRTQEAAIVTIDSSTTGVTTVRVDGPRYDTADTPADKRHPFQPTGLMEKVSRVLENANCPMSRSAIDASVQGRREFVFQAIDCLILDDYAAEDGPSKNGGRPTVRLIRSYREAGDPFPDLDPSDLVPEGCRGPRTRSGVTTPEPAERVGPPSDTRSRNGSGTGRERVGLDSLYTQGDEDVTDSVNPEDLPVQHQFDLKNSGGNGSGTGLHTSISGGEGGDLDD